MQESRLARWSKASALAIGFALLGCSSEVPGRDGSEQSDQGAIYGELSVYIATFDDGTTDTQYFLQVNGDEQNERRLMFAVDPNLPSGTKLKVWGVEVQDRIEVKRFELFGAATGSTSQALVNGTKLPPKKFAMVFVNTGAGVNLTEADARLKLFGTAAGNNSVKQYYLETSYGVQDVEGDVFGPLNFTMNGCDTRGLATALRPQVTGEFDHYLWYLGARTSACSWSGLASVGTPDNASRDTWYNGSSSCVVLVQEPGHNFGMAHSSSLDCGTAVFADNPNGACTHSEYGDRFDPMGGGCRHMNAWQKTYQGWHGGCNSVKVNSSGTFTLFPLETACNGIQVLQIPMPKVRPFTRPAGGGSSAGVDNLGFYYLELRTASGFDGTGQAWPGLPTVLVHVADNYRLSNQRGLHTWILDMNPTSSSFDGLGAGGTFTDPAGGLSFSVQTIDATKATIQVTIAAGTGASTCLDGTTLTAPGPSSCGNDGVSGAGGMAGTAGTGGTDAGVSGSSGAAGSGGTAGGASGSAGTGTAGSSGVPGTGGSGIGASGGSNPDGPRANDGPSEVEGSCACRTTPERHSAKFGVTLGFVLLGLLGWRRRHTSASHTNSAAS